MARHKKTRHYGRREQLSQRSESYSSHGGTTTNFAADADRAIKRIVAMPPHACLGESVSITDLSYLGRWRLKTKKNGMMVL